MQVDDATLDKALGLFPGDDFVQVLEDDAKRAAARDAIAAVVTPDVEVEMIGGGGSIGPYSGPDALERSFEEWLAAFSSYRLEVEPEVRRSRDAVVFFAKQVAIPRGTEKPVTTDGTVVMFFARERVRRIEFHLDRDAALRSAGLA